MKRIQLFEIEDFEWLPSSIRNSVTNLIMILMKMMNTREVLGELILQARNKHSFNRIVDLGSGSGGAMPETVKFLNAAYTEKPLDLLLTDLYPNPTIARRFNEKKDRVSYCEIPVDAVSLAQSPKGLKTMINSFHHMPPDKAKKILHSASESKQPLLIFELAENKMPLVIWWMLLPVSLCVLVIMSLFMTLFVRPLTWQQIIFTYLIPIVPLCYAWDGQASYPRTYSYNDVHTMLEDIPDSDYCWEVGPGKKRNGKHSGYYILGYPKRI
ncbi:hypothetical protein [Phaeodactylibacter sp.]|uniref:hypothetical protein n=1 Tax=Phaeodactylibacter sp. TaxID=1940289 RepID=UPI0025FF16D9|nr:hypothetical protein [Phaeodactylibacter sp.]MCI5091635.1 hypothetical protein [Phaeodactylibacter sp.]